MCSIYSDDDTVWDIAIFDCDVVRKLVPRVPTCVGRMLY